MMFIYMGMDYLCSFLWDHCLLQATKLGLEP